MLVSGTGTGSAARSGDQNVVRMRFGDAGGDRADTDLRNEFDADTGVGIGVFQIKNQLRQIFNRIDIMMRWWTDQASRPASSDALRQSLDRLCDPVIRRLRPVWRPVPF